MLRSFDVFDVRRFHEEGRHEVGLHAHRHGQFTCVISGVVSQETDAGIWVVPRDRLIWVPPHAAHSVRSDGVEGWLVLVPPSFTPRLPDRICVLESSALLRASLERLTTLDESDRKVASALSEVILLEIDHARTCGLEIPMPRSPRLRTIAERLLKEPNDDLLLDGWASEAALSRRSFTRHFVEETGLSFAVWRRRVIASRAVELLSAGESVSSVALAMGYESVSAFVAMFKRLHGAPPARFLSNSR
ncbi:MAG: helix-turn-helix transcriptional regulator [Burkholderiales bacterium]|nr:helix-turn-helix transcriptional regulator [Burkholderiales bacterium]